MKGRVDGESGERFAAVFSWLLSFSADLNAILLSEPLKVIVSREKQINNLVCSDDHLIAVFYNVHQLIVPVEIGFTRKDEHTQILIPKNPENIPVPVI